MTHHRLHGTCMRAYAGAGGHVKAETWDLGKKAAGQGGEDARGGRRFRVNRQHRSLLVVIHPFFFCNPTPVAISVRTASIVQLHFSIHRLFDDINSFVPFFRCFLVDGR